MISFSFRGRISASKSLMNRALMIQSFFPSLQIIGHSVAQDVLDMKNALKAFEAGEKELWVGEGGTVLRFLLFRVSRRPGQWILRGTTRLFSRPQFEGGLLLEQLGVSCRWARDHVIIDSEGWRRPSKPLNLVFDSSSQFASGLVLSSLDFADEISFTWSLQDEKKPSWSYFAMTVELFKLLGVPFTQETRGEDELLLIPKKALPRQSYYEVEPDWSSLAALLVAARVGGDVVIEGLGSGPYLQPDAEILHLFGFSHGNRVRGETDSLWTDRIMNQRSTTAEVQESTQKDDVMASSRGDLSTAQNIFHLKAGPIPSFHWSFRQTPDLLPVLAVLAAFSDGDCVFTDFARAAVKESDRVSNTLKLLGLAGVACSLDSDRMVIQGQGLDWTPASFEFDPDQDHRMAMAAGILKLRQPQITILHPEVVNKSFPEFWRILRESGLTE